LSGPNRTTGLVGKSASLPRWARGFAAALAAAALPAPRRGLCGYRRRPGHGPAGYRAPRRPHLGRGFTRRRRHVLLHLAGAGQRSRRPNIFLTRPARGGIPTFHSTQNATIKSTQPAVFGCRRPPRHRRRASLIFPQLFPHNNVPSLRNFIGVSPRLLAVRRARFHRENTVFDAGPRGFLRVVVIMVF